MFIEGDKQNKQNALEAAGRFGLDGEEDDGDDTDFINQQMNNGTGGIMAGGAGITPPTDQYTSIAAQVGMYGSKTIGMAHIATP